ncbi:unnamed protein product [Mytilus edulis]|uniref:Myb/SANT-like DNA-binding domain-containing protein n=1 Tax=Mytilus edulis TaxID=6550 RepID=A0A8S3Q672_MYTED|nr:unnamed protein product [Mytilus edulis]
MAEEQPPKKIPRIRGQNFSSIEVNLISRRVVEELGLLRGKFGKDVTADAKNKMWEKITAEVNALGVSYRQVLTVKTKFRNLTRYAKDKFTYEKKERNRTGGGPAPKPISVAEENIINAFKDTSSFKGIDDGMEISLYMVLLAVVFISQCTCVTQFLPGQIPRQIIPGQIPRQVITGQDIEEQQEIFLIADDMTAAPCVPTINCPAGYVLLGDQTVSENCYFSSVQNGAVLTTWASALAKCTMTPGAYIWRPNSEAETKAVFAKYTLG